MRGPLRAHAWFVALAAAATACSPSPPPQFATAVGEEPNTIHVTTAAVTHAVHFPAGVATLSPEAMASLQDFLRDQQARPGETATVQADGSPLGEARRSRVVAALRRSGLAPVSATPGAALARDTLAVTLEHVTVVVPHCPNWPQLVGTDVLNAPSSNLGCADATDLAAIVADPHDLVSGRDPGPSPAEPAIRAVEVYRTGGPVTGAADKGGASSGPAPAAAPSTTSGGTNAQ